MIAKILLLIFIVSHLSAFSYADQCRVFGDQGLSSFTNHDVNNYAPTYDSCFFQGNEVISIRSLDLNDQKAALLVNPENSQTELIRLDCLSFCKEINPSYFIESFYGSNHYKSFLPPFLLTNDGLITGKSNEYTALTVDMCPSSRGLSTQVYEELKAMSEINSKAVPVGIAMTRRWLKRWPDEFAYLKKLQLEGHLNIEWINHSANHRYSPSLPLENNFLLKPGTDMEDEVLGNEIALIQNGVTPSPYFRFPGLVSDYETINYVANLGLITLGSDAWLAKGQKPKFGSIILIHGNRNEVLGEKKLIEYIKTMNEVGHQFGSLFHIF